MFKILRNIAVPLAATLLFSTQANAGFIPIGVQQDVALATVTGTWGWAEIYRGGYDVDTVSVADAFAGHGAYVMLGAIQDGSDTIKVLAAISWADFIVHTAHNVTNTVNGAQWYNNGGSLGFAGLGDTINQGAADTSGVNAGLRLSWHTDAGGSIGDFDQLAVNMRYGWRAGEVTHLNDSTDWDKIIFTTNIEAAPEPMTAGLLLIGLAGVAVRRRRRAG